MVGVVFKWNSSIRIFDGYQINSTLSVHVKIEIEYQGEQPPLLTRLYWVDLINWTNHVFAKHTATLNTRPLVLGPSCILKHVFKFTLVVVAYYKFEIFHVWINTMPVVDLHRVATGAILSSRHLELVRRMVVVPGQKIIW